MVNGAVYVVLAAIVIIITIMIWNRKVDTYSHIYGCQMQCRDIADATDRNLCTQKCLGHQIMKYGGQQCAKDEDCQSQQVCVLGGFYTDKDGNVFPNPDVGTCMDENDPGAVQWKRRSAFHRPNLPYGNGDLIPPSSPCMSNCSAAGRSMAECQAICSHVTVPHGHPSLPGHPSKCMSKCLAEGNSNVNCQTLCEADVGQYLKGKGPAVTCATRCMSESGQYGDYNMDMAKDCRIMCGLPNYPSACMRRCKSERGSAAECHGICDPPTQPDDGDYSHPSWAFTMSGEITPSKVENYGPETCLPGMYWNAYGNGGKGGCENIYQGKSSSWYLHHQKPDAGAEVSIPGTTLLGYGVGMTDPMDKPTGVIIASDPGYKHPY